MKKLFVFVAAVAISIPMSLFAEGNVVKNGDFKVALSAEDVNPTVAEQGQWYIFSSRAALNKYTIEPVVDAENGNAVRIENTVDAAWYSHYLMQKVTLDASKGTYTLSMDIKSDSGAPIVRAFLIDAVGDSGAVFIAREGFDIENPKTLTHSAAAASIGIRGKKWKNYTCEFDASQFINTIYSPTAAKKTGKPIEYQELEGENEFYIAIQVPKVGEALIIDNIKLAPTE